MSKEEKKESKMSFGRVVSNNLYMLRLTFQCCPSRVIGEFLMQLSGHAENIYWSIIFQETVVRFIEEGESFSKVVPFLVGSVLFILLLHVYRDYFWNITQPIGNHKVYEKMHLRMFEKATDVELECYENPEFYDKYMKAVMQIKSRAHAVVWVVASMSVSAVALVYLIYKTWTIDKFAIIFALLPLVSTYYLGNKINQAGYELYQVNIQEVRRKEYVKRAIYQQDYAKELRLSNAFAMLLGHFKESVEAVVKNTKKYGLRIGLLSCLSEGVNQVFITAGSVLYATVRLVYFKDLRVSEYLVLVSAIYTISNILVQNARCLTKFNDNALYIQNIREFFDYEPKISESQPGRAVDREEFNLRMEDVSFTYFGQEKPVLKHINLKINKGEKIALVGENGAGKSTLVKLLMRLYDPGEGKVTLNRTDVRKYALQDYRKLFATVFQDFKVFSLSVAENVLSRKLTSDEDRKTVEEALKNSGAFDKIQTLPKGMDTTLTKEFDPEGAVLSGGENQKIAIARVFAKDSEIAILDEPSSALDPVAEYQMYESMLRACRDKAVIFISHRLSSAVLADRIYMLENGEIVECGSHKELMDKNGKYAQMFHFQAKNYVGEVS